MRPPSRRGAPRRRTSPWSGAGRPTERGRARPPRCAGDHGRAVAPRPQHGVMDAHELAQLRDQEDREQFAIHWEEQAMEAEARALEHGLDELRAGVNCAEHAIEDEWRTEHWGREPDRPAAWGTAVRSRRRRSTRS